ncbi:MAG: DNA (cytosine-5-)-methyltransferase [Opitutales bacterium]|nr:DNA (cytosine-5-)-methyltransferase [Opitutales bacterium]
MGRLKLLDLFSGIGGFTIAAERAGIETVAFCEIDKFPQSVLRFRYPDIPIIGDARNLTKQTLKSATGLDYVDIICGGSPCQDLSVAGKRAGLKGKESGLFYEYARIVNELKPKYVVWENVPGALSSDGGKDFETVLRSFTGHSGIKFARWGNAGYVEGKDGFYNAAYRVLDSRFFGVPQRRRRIFLVASLGDESCAEILFEQAGVRGDCAQGEKQEQNVAAFAESGFGEYVESRVSRTLTKSSGACSGGSETLVLTENSGDPQVCSPTIAASMSHIYNKQTPILFENHAQDSRYSERETSPAISARCGTGGNNLPLVVKQHNYGEISVSEVSPTLNSQPGAGRIPMAVSIAENIINRQDHNGGNGIGAAEENCYTLNATGVHAVAARSQIRRLTPLECERLQGFPDNWTLSPDARDTNRYKACGNAITVNVAEWIFKRLAKCAGAD